MTNLFINTSRESSIAYEVFSIAEKNKPTNPNIKLDTDKFTQEIGSFSFFNKSKNGVQK